MGRRGKDKRDRKTERPNRDLTPAVGSETDVAPLGRGGEKPAHERAADEDVDLADWDRVASRDDFRGLIAARSIILRCRCWSDTRPIS
jgi:hypothetical protein